MKLNRYLLAIWTAIPLWTAPGLAKTNLIALMPPDTQFQTVLAGIRAELDTAYSIDVVDMSKPFKTEDVAKKCGKNDIKGLIVMDRKAIRAIQDLEKTDSSFRVIPKFVYMTLMAEETTSRLSNVAGITFEIPIYTLVTRFRIVSQKDFSKIGIYHRKLYSGTIDEAKKLLFKEQITVQTVCIDCEKGGKLTAQKAVRIMNTSFEKMVTQQGSEVFLVLADNVILNNTTLGDFWLGTVKKRKVPVIAPLDLLASPQIALAVFTVDPDLPQLGVQAANQIIEYFENETPLETIGFEPIISIKATLNKAVAEEIRWKLKEEKLGRINKIIK